MREAKNQVFENMEVRLIHVGSGALTKKDVKNEGRTDYVHENTDMDDKMSRRNTTFFGQKSLGDGTMGR